MEFIKTTLANHPEYYEDTVSLIEKAFHYREDNSFEIDFAPLMHPLNHHNLHILIKDNKVIAHIGIRKRDFGDDKGLSPVALIGGIAIDDFYRGQGVFKTFFEEVINLYKDKVAFFFLWSDLESLYKKFNFYQVGGQIQTGERTLLDEDLIKGIHKFKANKISEKDFNDMKQLYNENVECKHTSFIRDEISWSLIKEVTSTNYYLYKVKDKLQAYFCIGKGQDLESIVHELVVTDKYKEVIEDFISQYKLWLPMSENHRFNKSKILFTCFMKVGNTDLFNEFIQQHFESDLIVTDINDKEINFEFKNEKFILSIEEFLTAVFGPSFITEFINYTKPLYISGLDSI
jgi:hypothetical protein